MRAAEKRLAEEIASFATDPLGFTLFAYPWDERGTPLEGVNGPRSWQRDVLRDIGDHLSNPETRFTPLRLAVASGHGVGKSTLAAFVTHWALATCPGTRVVLTANTEGQLSSKSSPELQKWLRLSLTRDWFKHSVLSIVSSDRNHAANWRADLVPWSVYSPEAFAGLHNQGRRIVLIFDESAAIADQIWEVAEGALTDEHTEIIWLALGNPTRNVGRFRETFGRFRGMWKTRHVDSRDVEGVNRSELDEMIAAYGEDSDFVRVRIRGEFPSASSMQFIGSDMAREAAERQVGEGVILPNDPIVLGLDHARFGDDSTVLAIRQGRDAKSRPWRHWKGANSMEIAGDVAQVVQQYAADGIFIDSGGPNAGGVIDRLRQLLPEFPVYEINFGGKGRDATWQGEVRTGCSNKRCEMWTNMRAWLERGAIPDEDRLIQDLIGPEYSYNAANQIVLERKEDMRRRGLASPDWGDALALTFAEYIQPRELPTYLNPETYGFQREYDRFEELTSTYDREAL